MDRTGRRGASVGGAKREDSPNAPFAASLRKHYDGTKDNL